MRRRSLAPKAAKHMKRIGCHTAYPMIGRSHDEFCTGGNGTEFPNYQLIAKLRIVEKHVIFFEGRRLLRVIVIRILPDMNIRRRNHIFDKAGCFVGVWKYRIRAWYVRHKIPSRFFYIPNSFAYSRTPSIGLASPCKA